MSSSKQEKRPLSWFGLRLGSRRLKADQRNDQASKNSAVCLKDTEVEECNTSPKKGKLSKKFSKHSKKASKPQKQNCLEQTCSFENLPDIENENYQDLTKNMANLPQHSFRENFYSTNCGTKDEQFKANEQEDRTENMEEKGISIPCKTNSNLENVASLKTSNADSVKIVDTSSVSKVNNRFLKWNSPSILLSRSATLQDPPMGDKISSTDKPPIPSNTATTTLCSTSMAVSTETNSQSFLSTSNQGHTAQVTVATTITTTTFAAATAATAAATPAPTVKIPPRPRYNLDFLGDLQSKHKFSMAVGKQNDVANSGEDTATGIFHLHSHSAF
ncbi:hypothetical protein PoB_002806600 [Plakobranchus ocellatus]|uniref:Uncharacterized protein n=1 Tax=Plakobranchus ocellatus TaxID=259542 RepID=A0AAV4A4J4_9GAST|nr:hypothetical protein PoB_002806600 [Plakobranchus ocellatus]